MTTVNMLEAKSNLSRLVEAVETGAEREIVIARNGKPIAKLVPYEAKPKGKRLGLLEGPFEAPTQDEFDAANDAIAALFRNDAK